MQAVLLAALAAGAVVVPMALVEQQATLVVLRVQLVLLATRAQRAMPLVGAEAAAAEAVEALSVVLDYQVPLVQLVLRPVQPMAQVA